jgi:N-acetyl-anhydromuramyl-L-alanine amidase AmpD
MKTNTFSARFLKLTVLLFTSVAFGQDYPGALWNPAHTNNYGVASRTSTDIRWIVIHTTEDAPGSDCSTSQNWFKNADQNGDGTPGVSAHYVICRDGTVVQMVRDKDIAYHAGNFPYNQQSIGIEHERHDTSNWTEAQFQASVQLVKWLVAHYSVQSVFPGGIAPANPSDGSGVVGHNQVPDPNNPTLGGGINHKPDPVNWDWPHYQDLFVGSNFLVAAERAIRVSFPTRDGYQYQVFSSTDLTSWLPASQILTACGGTETVSFPATNGNAFYRAQEWPPNLSTHIVGLTNVFLDTARLSSRSNQMTIEGMRVQSRDYTFNDFLTATYGLDFCKQSFVLQQLDVITNVGATCGVDPVFFLKDATNALVTGGGAVEDTTYPLTTTGLTFTVSMSIGNMLELVTSSASADYRTIVTGPTGAPLANNVFAAGSGSVFHYPINAYRPGLYSVRIEPFGSTNVSLNLRFRNLNRRPTTTVVSGGTISASLQDYWADYAKFKISASAGQTLRLASTPGTNESVTVCDSLGIVLAGWTGGGSSTPLIVPIAKTGDYFILYFHREYSANSFSTTVTLTP